MEVNGETETEINKISLDNLKILAKNSSKKRVKKVSISTSQYSRSPYIAAYAKKVAKGKCQLCDNPAPFVDKSGAPYLESHHIVWLKNGGSDSIDNVVALCPNCHRAMHILNDAQDVKILINKAKELSK